MNKTDDKPLILTICEYAKAKGAAWPLNKHEGIWSTYINDKWFVALNPHNEPHTVKYEGIEHVVEPFNAVVWYNGWPAGVVDPAGHTMVATSETNEQALLAAIRAQHSATGGAG